MQLNEQVLERSSFFSKKEFGIGNKFRMFYCRKEAF